MAKKKTPKKPKQPCIRNCEECPYLIKILDKAFCNNKDSVYFGDEKNI